MIAAFSAISLRSVVHFPLANDSLGYCHRNERAKKCCRGSLLPTSTKEKLRSCRFCCSALNGRSVRSVPPLSIPSLNSWSRDVTKSCLSTGPSSPVQHSFPSRLAYTPNKMMQQRRGDRVQARSRGFLTDEEEKTSAGGATIGEQVDGRGGGNKTGDGGGGGEGGDGDAVKWLSSAIVFAFWAGLLLYSFTMSPNQTQYRDTYFVEKLLGLHSDDGFIMNKVLVAEWYFMGMWPVIYSSLLIPAGRSYKNRIKVWPFLLVSVGLGTFALLPYFGLWRPPPPPVKRREQRKLPLNLLESKITSAAALIVGVGLASYAGLAGADQWEEFYQYFRSSRFIHIMTIDFAALWVLAPFWVYNDLSVRRRSDTFSWLVPLSIIPYLGPALYLCFRPALPSAIIDESDESEETSTQK